MVIIPQGNQAQLQLKHVDGYTQTIRPKVCNLIVQIEYFLNVYKQRLNYL